MPLVSILIPVYNVEHSLAKCLDSALGQSWRGGLEVIAINDGSTDRSLEILEEYASRDKRLKVIDQPNAGLIMVRKRGVEAAKGEFVFFFDSDDYISPNMIEVLYDGLMRHDCDIATSRMDEVRHGVVSETFNKGVPEKIGAGAFLRGMINFSPYTVTRAVIGRLYSKHLFDGVAFDREVVNGEDYITNVQIALRPDFRGVCFCDDATYYYVRNPHSLSNTRYPLEYDDMFARKLDALLATRPDLKSEWFDEWPKDRVMRVYKYISRSSNPWRGDSYIVESARDAVLRDPAAARRLLPALAPLMIRMYSHRWLKPAVDAMSMFMRWGRSAGKRLRKIS